MQLTFKIQMLLSETRAFPGELKVVYCRSDHVMFIEKLYKLKGQFYNVFINF